LIFKEPGNVPQRSPSTDAKSIAQVVMGHWPGCIFGDVDVDGAATTCTFWKNQITIWLINSHYNLIETLSGQIVDVKILGLFY